MKLSHSWAALVLATGVAAASWSDVISVGGQKVLAGGAAVPGDNPLEYCKADHKEDILVLDHVNLSPNPPSAGQSLTIEASGELLKDVDKGAYVILQVKYGLIRLVSTKADLCEQVSNVDMECPIKKGQITITKDVTIPDKIPPGKYTVFADVYTADDKPITCLEATVTFGN